MKQLLILFCLVVNLASSCQSDGGDKEGTSGEEKVTYAASNEVFTNPERGFMHTWQVNSEGSAMTATSLANLKKKM